MKKQRIVAGTLVLAAIAFGLAAAMPVLAQDKPAYTPAEYNAYTACANDKVAASRVKCLDDFVAKFPDSTLMPFVYRFYYTTYNELRNFPKVIEYADKSLALGDKLEAGSKLEAIYLRTLAFHASFSDKAPDAQQQAAKARAAAEDGLNVLTQIPKPEQMTPEQFEKQKEGPRTLFTYTIGYAALQMKDYGMAVEKFKAVLTFTPTDGATHYRLALAYLQQDPPRFEDGLWELGRAIALKAPGEAQLRNYMRAQLQRYQQTACEREVDSQVNELIALATASPERPAGHHVPSAAELDEARKNPGTFLQALQGGGDQAKVTWLAMCGLEFPEVAGKVIEVAQGNDSVNVKLFLGVTPEETEAGTTPNMEVKVLGQPAARLLKKDDAVRFSGMLARYTPEPFMVSWDNARINPEDLPEDKPQPPKKPPTKRPARKRPPAGR